MTAQSIKVSGPFKVRQPHDVSIDSEHWPKSFWPVVNEGNIGVGSAIAWCPDKYNAQWVANALNMLHSIDQATILRNTELPATSAEQLGY